jgi:hypothetical protein
MTCCCAASSTQMQGNCQPHHMQVCHHIDCRWCVFAQDTKGALDILSERVSIRFTRKPPLPLAVDKTTNRILLSLDAETLPPADALPGGQAALEQLLSRTFRLQAVVFSQVCGLTATCMHHGCQLANCRPSKGAWYHTQPFVQYCVHSWMLRGSMSCKALGSSWLETSVRSHRLGVFASHASLCCLIGKNPTIMSRVCTSAYPRHWLRADMHTTLHPAYPGYHQQGVT